LHDFVWILKVVDGEIGKLEAERRRRLKNALSIFKMRPNEDVDVA